MNDRTTRGWGSGRLGSEPDGRFVSRAPGVADQEPGVGNGDIAPAADEGYHPDIVLIVKQDGTVLFLNRQVPGDADGSGAGRSVYDFIAEEHHVAVRDSLVRVFSEQDAGAFVCCGGPPFAEGAWYHCRVAPNQRSGGVVSATIIARDITQWKKHEDGFRAEIEQLQARLNEVTVEKAEIAELLADQERREQELSRFRKIMDQAGEAIFITDPRTGRFIDVNDTACRWLGFRREKVLKMGVRDLDLDFPLESPDGVVDHVTNTRDASRPRIFDGGSHRRRNGTAFPVEVALARQRFGDREYMLVVARDVNRPRQTEQALREAQDNYRSLFELSREAIYCSARDGTVAAVNDSAIDIFGYTRAEFLGLEARKLYKNPEDIREFQRRVEKNGSTRNLEVEFLTKSGQPFKGMLAATLRSDGGGSVQGYQCLISPFQDAERSLDVTKDSDGLIEAAEPPEKRNTVVMAGKEKWIVDEVRTVLDRAGVEVLSARTAGAAVELVRAQPASIGAALLDFASDDSEFQDSVSEIRNIDPTIHVILFEEEDGGEDKSAWANAVVRKPVHPLALVQQVRESLNASPLPELNS